MSKIFPRFFLPLLAAAFIVACIRIPKQPQTTDPDTTPLTYRFDGGADLTALFTLQASYIAADGRTQTEQIASLPWAKEVGVPALSVPVSTSGSGKRPTIPGRTYMLSVFRAESTVPPRMRRFPLGLSRAGGAGNIVRLRFSLPDGVSPDDVSLRFAPLKYDKHFAFTFTCDDSYVTAYSLVWSLINARWIDDREFRHLDGIPTSGYVPDHALVMTDGCGNDRRFGFSCSVWPTWGRADDPANTYVKDLVRTGADSMYISWEELRLLSDFGVSMLFHNVDERVYGKADPALIAQGFRDDYDKVCEKLGLRMKVLGLPDGNEAYAEAAQQSDLIHFTRNSLAWQTRIYLHTCGDLRKGQTYGGGNNSDPDKKLAELAEQAVSGNPYWVGLTIHRGDRSYAGRCSKRFTAFMAKPAATRSGSLRGTRFTNMSPCAKVPGSAKTPRGVR